MLVLHLFNGRKLGESPEDGGEEGPTFPVRWVHATGDEIKICRFGEVDCDAFDSWESMPYYDGLFYGDWCVYDIAACPDPPRPLIEFDPEKAIFTPKIAADVLRRQTNRNALLAFAEDGCEDADEEEG